MEFRVFFFLRRDSLRNLLRAFKDFGLLRAFKGLRALTGFEKI